MVMKRCSKCGDVKALEDFQREKKGKDGRRGDCKQCVSKKMAEYNQRPEARERRCKRMREYRQRPEVKERKRQSNREYRQRPEVKMRRRRKKRAIARLRGNMRIARIKEAIVNSCSFVVRQL